MMPAFIKKHSTVTVIGTIIVLILAGVLARAFNHGVAPQSSNASMPVVQLLNVSDYSQNSKQLSANGTVESLQQAQLKAQASGKITKINVTVGQHVSQGQVLAVIDQSAALAAVTSAQGLVQQAQASYQKLLAGASNENIAIAQVALDNAQAALKNTVSQQTVSVSNAYKSLLNSSLVPTAATNNAPNITPTISGSFNGSAQGAYNITIISTGGGLRFSISGLESGDGPVSLNPQPMGKNGLSIQFSDVNVPANSSWTLNIPNTQSAAYVANNNAYQAALQAQKTATDGAQSAVDSARAALDLTKSQARPADISAAQAAVTSAQGQLQSANVALENTIIRAPFDGSISAVPVKFADLVSPGQGVVSIVNQGGLQIKVFVSNQDLVSIHVNDKVKIGPNNIDGTITNAAPSVDPTTKTAEVDIAVADPKNSGLTIGQNVNVGIDGSAADLPQDVFSLPIQAVKITPDGHSYVYTLDADSKAQEVEVTTGTIDGEHVQVTKGLNKDMKIVSNAYDVSAGDKVQIGQ